MKYYFERYYPIFLAVVITICFYLLRVKIGNVDDAVKRLLDTALAVSGALLGFLLTILTIINSIDTRRMRFIRESGSMPLLNHYLKVALFSNIVSVSIYFILPILFSIKEITEFKGFIYTVIVFIISFTWIANIRFSSIFIRLLTDPK